jgi:hypothetical protein
VSNILHLVGSAGLGGGGEVRLLRPYCVSTASKTRGDQGHFGMCSCACVCASLTVAGVVGASVALCVSRSVGLFFVP